MTGDPPLILYNSHSYESTYDADIQRELAREFQSGLVRHSPLQYAIMCASPLDFRDRYQEPQAIEGTNRRWGKGVESRLSPPTFVALSPLNIYRIIHIIHRYHHHPSHLITLHIVPFSCCLDRRSKITTHSTIAYCSSHLSISFIV